MHARYRLIIPFAVSLLGMLPRRAVGQDLQNFPYTDSLTRALVEQGRWRALDSVGRRALAAGTDYPVMRLRLGYAAAMQDKRSGAVRHYERALRADPLDSLARYGLVLAHLALSHRERAAFLARGLADSLRKQLQLRGFSPAQRVELEGTAQSTTTVTRFEAGIGRFEVGSQLRPWLYLTLGSGYFGQTVKLPEVKPLERYTIRQWDYQALLTFQFRQRWHARAGFHYIDSRFAHKGYPGRLAYGAVGYTHPYFTAQVGLYGGTLTDTTRWQADLRLTAYLTGSQRLYAFGRGSVVRSHAINYPNLLLGVGSRVRRWCWLEIHGMAGQVPVLAEADGTYVYNLLDPLRLRAGAATYLVLSNHLSARVYYVAERRHRAMTADTTYSLFALTTALQWTW